MASASVPPPSSYPPRAEIIFLRKQGRPRNPELTLLTDEERHQRTRDKAKAAYCPVIARARYIINQKRNVEYARIFYEQNNRLVNLNQKIRYHKKSYLLDKKPGHLDKIAEFEQELNALKIEQNMEINKKTISDLEQLRQNVGPSVEITKQSSQHMVP